MNLIKTLRVYYNVYLVRLGIRQILPSDYINGIRVVENKEPLVTLSADKKLIRTDGKAFIARQGMAEHLLKAAEEVSKKGYRLHIFQTYRSPDAQAERRRELHEQLRQSHPDNSEADILRMLNVGIAGVGGGHQTGGAVDLGLCDQDGTELDMGTNYLEHNHQTATRCKALSEEQKRNRLILLRAMLRAGFVNYPAEWWHFSYGDRMWAAYSNQKTAMYDVVNCQKH